MGLLRRGDVVKTVRPLRSLSRGFLQLPKGTTGMIGRLLRTQEDDGEELEIWDFLPDGYPGVWAVTEYHVRLVARE